MQVLDGLGGGCVVGAQWAAVSGVPERVRAACSHQRFRPQRPQQDAPRPLPQGAARGPTVATPRRPRRRRAPQRLERPRAGFRVAGRRLACGRGRGGRPRASGSLGKLGCSKTPGGKFCRRPSTAPPGAKRRKSRTPSTQTPRAAAVRLKAATHAAVLAERWLKRGWQCWCWCWRCCCSCSSARERPRRTTLRGRSRSRAAKRLASTEQSPQAPRRLQRGAPAAHATRPTRGLRRQRLPPRRLPRSCRRCSSGVVRAPKETRSPNDARAGHAPPSTTSARGGTRALQRGRPRSRRRSTADAS